MVPVRISRFSPAGNPVAVQLYRPVPPLTLSAVEKGTFSHATGTNVGLMEMHGACGATFRVTVAKLGETAAMHAT
jgi:hypothetical protein